MTVPRQPRNVWRQAILVTRTMTTPRPQAIAHRGASGYAYENSLAAFRLAAELGSDGVELDIHSTRDGGLVVHHDAGLPGLGLIGELELAAVRGARLPNGETSPTLAEALTAIGDRDVWVEVKTLDPAFDGTLFQTLDAGPFPARYFLHSFDHRIIRRLGQLRPAQRLGALLASYPIDPVAVLRETGADTLWQDWHLIDRPLVERVHAAGATIIAWTANDAAAIARLMALDVDGICGNYPDRILAARRAVDPSSPPS